MSTEVRLRRGTAAQHAAFTGALAEVTVNTDKKALHVHDGSTAGGNRTLMLSELGAASGVASLDDSGQVPGSMLGNALAPAANNTLTGHNLFDNTGTSGYTEVRRDSAPLNYINTRASFVLQHRDAASGADQELIPGAMFQFKSTGDGNVVSGSELSTSIWMGLTSVMAKTGDGSGHSFTAIGELGAYGAGTYNELGLFQGTGTNIGSTHGTISGVEMLIQDGNSTTHFDTAMHAVIGRIARFHNGAKDAANFFASSEGTVAPNAILSVNNAGFKTWVRGIDLSKAIFTTGQAILLGNNVSVAWTLSTAATVPVLFVNNIDDVYLAATKANAKIHLVNSALADRLVVDTSNANDAIQIWIGGALKRLGTGVADSAGAGFRTVIVPN